MRTLTDAQIYSVIYAAWIVGFCVLIASWVRIVSNSVGWVGFTIGMTATAASWADDRQLQFAIGAAGAFLIFILLVSRSLGSKRLPRPGDYEAELLRLCNGDAAVASRLIKHELKRHSHFTRQAAAMAAVARLKQDRSR